MVMSLFSELFSVLATFVQSVFSLRFFGFPSFFVFCLVCFALYLFGWVLKCLWGGDDK